ncbi:MAG: hypothetical protein R3F56_11225 [Planctomycetota bacterium]
MQLGRAQASAIEQANDIVSSRAHGQDLRPVWSKIDDGPPAIGPGSNNRCARAHSRPFPDRTTEPMNGPTTAVVAVLFSAATAAAVTWLYHPERALPASESAADTALAQRVAELEGSVKDALRRLERLQADTAAPVTRASLERTVPEAEIEAAIAKYLAAHGAEKPDGAAGPSLTKAQALARLYEVGGDYEKIQKIWDEVEGAGLEDDLLAHFKALAAASPTDASAQYLYGAYLLAGIEGKPMDQQGKMAIAADAAFDRTLKLDDKHWAARFMKATSLSFWPKITGKQTEALKHFQILADQQEHEPQQPHFAQTYVFLGNMLADQGDRDQARAAYERGLRWFPDNKDLKQQLAALGK